jgi:hypothetical protein
MGTRSQGKMSICSGIIFAVWHLELPQWTCNQRREICPDLVEWSWASGMTTVSMKYSTVKYSSSEKISTTENALGLKKIVAIEFPDPMACFTHIYDLTVQGSQVPTQKLLDKIHNVSPNQNPAQFQPVAFWRQLVSEFTYWMHWGLYSIVCKWATHCTFRTDSWSTCVNTEMTVDKG